jgi:hypothetical protein
MEHRGRIQAQGENLEESEAWSQNEPFTKQEALHLLNKLKNKIPKNDAKIRAGAFFKAAKFIENGPYQIVTKAISKSFKVPDTEHERVDVDIQRGTAFI